MEFQNTTAQLLDVPDVDMGSGGFEDTNPDTDDVEMEMPDLNGDVEMENGDTGMEISDTRMDDRGVEREDAVMNVDVVAGRLKHGFNTFEEFRN